MGYKTIALLLGWLAALGPAAAQAVAPWGLLTIADGEVTVLRARARFAAVEGQRLEPLDIVHTGAGTRVARLEFDDGNVLDLGPATQVLLRPQGTPWPKERAALAYVAQGWVKLRAPAAANAATQGGLTSATLDLTVPDGGVVLARIGARAAFAFVESGRAQLAEHVAPRPPRMFALGEGHAYARSGGAEAGVATLRPGPELRDTPRALTDALPRRAVEWARRTAPELGDAQAITAGDLAPWLDTDPALSSVVRARFLPPVRVASRAPVTSTASAGSQLGGAHTKPRDSRPVRTALLAPARLAALVMPERNALPLTLGAERPTAWAASAMSVAALPRDTAAEPVLASVPATPSVNSAANKPSRSPARSRVSL